MNALHDHPGADFPRAPSRGFSMFFLLRFPIFLGTFSIRANWCKTKQTRPTHVHVVSANMYPAKARSCQPVSVNAYCIVDI